MGGQPPIYRRRAVSDNYGMTNTTNKLRPTVLLAFDALGDYWLRVARGAADVLRDIDVDVHLTHQLPPNRLVNDNQEIKGVIARVASVESMRALQGLRVPIVNVGNARDEIALPRVGVDDRAVGVMLCDHLAACGVRVMAYAGDSTRFARERGAGFVARAKELGATVVGCRVEHKPGTNYGRVLQEWIQAAAPHPLGLACVNDGRADAMINHALLAGLKPGQNPLVIGVDNELVVQLRCRVPLSSVDVPGDAIGRTAAEMLLTLMKGEPPAAPVIIPPVRVVARRSTQPVKVADPAIQRAQLYMAEHATSGVSVDDVVTASRVSRRTLESRFRTHLNSSIHDQLQALRLARARDLLSDTTLPLAEVSRLSGFGGVGHFIKSFKLAAGLTPGQFRVIARGHGEPDAVENEAESE